MYTKAKIKQAIKSGTIEFLEDLPESQISVNSIDLRLNDDLSIVEHHYGEIIDPLAEYKLLRLPFQSHDYAKMYNVNRWLIEPGQLYLASTLESIKTENYIVCQIDGKSSLARLGLGVHITAGRGDVGFEGRWTLEITAQKPIFLYPGMLICQIYFFEVDGKVEQTYNKNGKYVAPKGVTPSKYFLNELNTLI